MIWQFFHFVSLANPLLYLHKCVISLTLFAQVRYIPYFICTSALYPLLYLHKCVISLTLFAQVRYIPYFICTSALYPLLYLHKCVICRSLDKTLTLKSRDTYDVLCPLRVVIDSQHCTYIRLLGPGAAGGPERKSSVCKQRAIKH